MKRKIKIAEMISAYRKDHGLSQGEFGAMLGVSAFAVSNAVNTVIPSKIA